jgi:hypothetical protein
MVDDANFAAGFEQGFRAIRGAIAHLPHTPHQPHTKHGRTAFQMGIMRRIERGKGWDRGALLDRD